MELKPFFSKENGMKAITSRGGPNFMVVVVWVALMGGLTAAVCGAIGVQAWVMFIGWCTYLTGNGSPKAGGSAVSCALLGVPAGMAGAVLLGHLTSLGPNAALSITVFVLAFGAMLTILTPPVNSVVGYFLGMSAYFGSRLEPTLANIAPLVVPLAIGGAASCIAGLGVGRIREWVPSR
jgi:hypothetical protein